MPPRKQPRSIARELALLGISQIKTNSQKLADEDLSDFVLSAVRTLTTEVQDILETASAETRRGEERLLSSETRANDLESAKAMVTDAVKLAQTAINLLGTAIEIPEFVQLANKQEVKEYAIEIIITIRENRQAIEKYLEEVLVAWQLKRLPKIDKDILTISVAEILYLDVPLKVAIDEAVELAKRYSDNEGFRFINGVLRRVSDRINNQEQLSMTNEP
ncbi:Transcription antitermination protein NusB [Hyella patelloides LEGE 07179]|uniref:Transcription antitermination protein NusB n=1 Tax=Hyella patelloides LEGE 07179 TaxID=945734 RepID=A0A563W234_9CYAN|nr:transcription antitermination factor NusB [Hyella patelloides]VEP17741.1 Transcription antitermination protein NusB [Hyella patelloides LEGE 07179]